MIEHLRNSIRDVPDFPKKGILFKDITTLLKNPVQFNHAIKTMLDALENRNIDLVASIESRGFIFGSVLAYELQAGFVPIRKPGKLPAKTVIEKYDLEYGTDQIEMHADAIKPGQHVLLVDDLLATGGTALAACKLIEQVGGNIDTVMFLIELEFLKGRNLLNKYNLISIITYN